MSTAPRVSSPSTQAATATATRARALLARLQDERVFVRMPGAAPLDRCIRVTVGTAGDRAEFARIFEAVVDEMVNEGVDEGGEGR